MKYFLAIVFLFLYSCSFAQVKQATDSLVLAGKLRIKNISVTGNKRTQTRIIIREMNLREGDLVHADSLGSLILLNKLRLLNLPLFNEVVISIDTLSSDEINWKVAVKERWNIWPKLAFQLADRNFNVWWNEQNHDVNRAIIGLSVTDNNFRGNLEKLSIGAQIGYTRKFLLEYQRPYLDRHQKHGAGISFGFAESKETFYKTDSNKLLFIKPFDRFVLRQNDITLSYYYRPAYSIRHTIRLGYRHFEVDDTVLQKNPEYFNDNSNDLRMLEWVYRFDLNKVDNWNYPTKGGKIVVHLFSRIGFEGMNFQNYATVEAAVFHNPFPKWFTSVIFRGRLTAPGVQPYALRSSLGTKTEYVRGYEYYVVDGYQHGILRLDLKHEIFNWTIRKIPARYFSVIPLRIYPKIFFDAGYTDNDAVGNSFLNNRLLYGAGVGVDIVTGYDIKIRLEYAFNHLGQKDLFLHTNSE